MKPTQSILILFSLFLISNCGEKVTEEITQRHDDGSKKTYIKIYNKGKSDEITLNKIIYNKEGQIIYCRINDLYGKKDGEQIDSIYTMVYGKKYKSFRKRIFSNGKIVQEMYSISDVPRFMDQSFLEYREGKKWDGWYKTVLNDEVVMMTMYENVKKHSVHCNILSWIGPKGAITGFHADWSENINISIKGKKNFYLVSPKYNEFMYPSKKFERAAILSNVNLKDVDENKFPLFKKANIIKVILEEGDALYIPRGWWHYAESLTPTINVSFHYWNLFNFFRDMVIEISKMLLHNIGLYKKYNCTCHSYNEKGERFVRSKFMPQNILKIKRD